MSSVANIGTNGLRVRGSEVVTTAIKGNGTLVKIPFTPGKTTATQLDKQGFIYDRWSLNSCTIKFIGTGSVTSGWRLAMGVDYSTASSSATVDQIAALNPHRIGPAYKTYAIRQTRAAMPAKYLLTNGTGAGSVLFTILLAVSGGTDTDLPGSLEITYDIDLSYPHA